MFNHVVDEGEHKIGQKDDEPEHCLKPTNTWQPGELVTGTFDFTISSNPKPGTYRLVTGMYASVDLRRLQATASDGTPLGDYPELVTVVVR